MKHYNVFIFHATPTPRQAIPGLWYAGSVMVVEVLKSRLANTFPGFCGAIGVFGCMNPAALTKVHP
ncbi:hypothetical protein [Pseudomonas piscis]|uniref:hypothetical protein n=1 Tax=Pseudomonas piscis TaxID=2614538 RepID=UPI0015B4E14F|nr:hypothetical protein [Pseudomonas piscis]